MIKKISKKIISLFALISLLLPYVSFASLTISTDPATNITLNTARLNATAIVSGQNASVKFRYTTSVSNSCNGMLGFTEINGSPNPINFPGTIHVEANIGGLIGGTTYYFCALDQGNNVYGNVRNFVTTGNPPPPPGGFPTAITEGVNSITSTSANIQGAVTFPSGYSGTVFTYFRYSSTNPTSCNNTFGTATSFNTKSATGNFNSNISGLISNTKYWYCAIVGSTPVGGSPISFGMLNFFTTGSTSGGNNNNNNNSGPNEINNVETHAISGLTDTNVILRGSVQTTGNVAYAYFRYSKVEKPPIFCNEIFGSDMLSATATTPNISGKVSSGTNFSADVSGLEPDTQYSYCAVVSNSALNPTEIDYGGVVTFHTDPCQECPHTTVITYPPTNVTTKSATLKGSYGSSRKIKTYFEYKRNNLISSWIKVGEETHDARSYANMKFDIDDLILDKEYKVRAVAETLPSTNSGSILPTQTFYGQELTFKTRLKDANSYTGTPYVPGNGVGNDGNGNNLPSCTDGIQNGDETGVDIGGFCSTGGGYDTATCYDGIQNSNETGIDIGGHCSSGNGNTTTGTNGNNGIDLSGNGNGSGVWTGGTGIGFGNGSGTGVGTWTGTWTGGSGSGTYTGGGNGSGNWVGSNGTGATIFAGMTGTGNWTGGNGNGTWSGLGGTQNGPVGGAWSNASGSGTWTGSCTNGVCTGTWNSSNGGNPGGTSSANASGTWTGSNGTGAAIFAGMTGTGNWTGSNGSGTWTGNGGTQNGPISGTWAGANGAGTYLGSCTNGVCSGTWTNTSGTGGPGLAGNGNGAGTWVGSNGTGATIFEGVTGTGTFGGGTWNGVNMSSNNGGGLSDENLPPLHLGDTAEPPSDAIVRYHEGVETVFARQIVRKTNLAKKYGYVEGTNLQQFAWDLAHVLAKNFGYVNVDGQEIRVSRPDVSAYELRQIGNTVTVYEYYKNKIIDIRNIYSTFKNKNPYEYYFRKKR